MESEGDGAGSDEEAAGKSVGEGTKSDGEGVKEAEESTDESEGVEGVCRQPKSRIAARMTEKRAERIKVPMRRGFYIIINRAGQ